MNSAENVPPVSGVVANETEVPKVPAAANEGVFVSPDDLKRNGWWKNEDDVRVRVDAERCTLTDYSSGGQEIFYDNLEVIAEKLSKEGFAFFPIEGEAAQEKSVQVPVRGEDVLKEKEAAPDVDLEKRVELARELDEKMDQGTKEAEAILEKINGILSQAHELSREHGFEAIRAVLDEITSQVTEKIETVNSLSSTDDIANEGLVIDEAYITGKEQRWKALQGLCDELDTLGEHAARTLQSLEKLSAQAKEHDQEVPVIISGSDGDASGKLEKGPGKGGKPGKGERKGRGGKGGGSGDGGGDDTDSADVSPAEKKVLKKQARLLEKQARQQAEGFPVPDEVSASSAEPVATEVPTADTSWRKELDAFLDRPKAKEKVAMIEDIIREEWDEFSGYTHKESLKMGKRLSRENQMALWQDKGLPALEEMVVRHLNTFNNIDLGEGKKIFLAILRNLEEEAKKQQ